MEKKPLGPAKELEPVAKKISTTDPESGWFHKGDHKEVFAYSAQVACDKYGWALAYSVEAGNIHDSQAFPALFAKLEPLKPQFIIADSGYKIPSIAKFLIDKEITPVLPYTRPRGKKDLLRPKELIYDEHFDCVICPEHQAALRPEKATENTKATLQFVPIVPCYLYVRPVRTTKKLSHGIFGKTIWNSARTFVIKGG